MNHKHRNTLHALFAHPVSSNIDPKAVKSVLEALGVQAAIVAVHECGPFLAARLQVGGQGKGRGKEMRGMGEEMREMERRGAGSERGRDERDR